MTTTDENYRTGLTAEESTARYIAMTKDDPKAEDLYQEMLKHDVLRAADEPDPYTYPAGSNREESTLCDQVSDGKSNQVMRRLLIEVAEIITGDRQRDYGLPEINHQRTAEFWSTYLGIKVTPIQVCMMNDLQKTSRSMERITPDTFRDKVGFVANAAACAAAELPVNGT